MKIYAKGAPQQPSASQMVNKLGYYIMRNLDGAFKIQKSSNMCDVYVTFLYALPYDGTHPQDEVEELTLDINITTYTGKLRVNILEPSPREKTIMFMTFEPVKYYSKTTGYDLKRLFEEIMKKMKRAVAKEYTEFDFIF